MNKEQLQLYNELLDEMFGVTTLNNLPENVIDEIIARIRQFTM